MRPIDYSPLYRSTVGFDRLFNLLDSVPGFEQVPPTGFPPYNIERLSENEYRITMAVAGFAQDEIRVDVKEQALNVAGSKKPEEKERKYLHRGIAARNFERRFQLADHVKVSGAKLANGLLTIELVREIPEEKKPRAIAIEGEGAKAALTH